MPHTQSAQNIAPSTPANFFAQLNLDALKKRWTNLTSNTPNIPQNPLGELLLRHYQDKSAFDKLTSWWHDLPVLHKTSIATSITVIAGLVGAIMGLSIPFIAIATGIYIAAHKLLIHHEEHRRARGERFVNEIRDLTQKLDSMLARFKVIAADMFKSLEQVEIQTTEMLINNRNMSQKIGLLTIEKDELKKIIATLAAQTTQMKQAQSQIVDAVNGVEASFESADKNLGHTSVTLQQLDGSLQQFADMTSLMHQTESTIADISNNLNRFIQQAISSQTMPNVEENTKTEVSIHNGQHTIDIALAQHAQTLSVINGLQSPQTSLNPSKIDKCALLIKKEDVQVTASELELALDTNRLLAAMESIMAQDHSDKVNTAISESEESMQIQFQEPFYRRNPTSG